MRFFDLKALLILSAFFCYAAVAGFYPINGGRIDNTTVITSSASTSTLVATSNQAYIVEGTQNHAIKFPASSAIPLEWFYNITNKSTGNVTVLASDSSIIATVNSSRVGNFILKSRATAPGTWKWHILAGLNDLGTISGNASTADALSNTPTTCSGAQFSVGIQTNGNAICNTPLGTGDVNGPGSSTDSAIALFNGTTGKLIKNSSATIDGSGNVTANSFVGPLTGTASGNELPLTFNLPLSRSTNTISIPAANGSTDGYLSSTDWTTFNGKQAAGNYITALTGDVTASGPGSVAATIANDAVTNAKMANMATATFKGRTTAGTGDPEDLTATQATALLNNFVGDSGTGGTKGLVPAPAAGDAAAGKVLKADGTWGSAGTTSPLTTKGDLYTYDTGNARLAVGTDGYVLTADSTQAKGIKWAASGASAVTKSYNITSHGFAVNDVIYCTAATTCAKAIATANNDASDTMGIVTAVADANNFTITTYGYASTLSGLTANTVYWLSDATAGLLTSTQPTTVGHVSKLMLKTDSTTSGKVYDVPGDVITAAVSNVCGSYTPTFTGLGTVTNISFYYCAMGKLLFVWGTAKTGTTAASAATITIPSGYSFDTTKQDGTNAGHFGTYVRGTASTEKGGVLFWNTGTSTNNLYFSEQEVFGTGSVNALISANGNNIMGNTELFSVNFMIPIQ